MYRLIFLVAVFIIFGVSVQFKRENESLQTHTNTDKKVTDFIVGHFFGYCWRFLLVASY